MIQLRRPHHNPTPRTTGGDDQPTPACAGISQPFDMLIDYGPTQTTRHALVEAANLCGSCPIQTDCWAANWDEPWMLAMRGQSVPRHHKPQVGAA